MGILEVKNISKQFPGTLALDNVSCQFESGMVHGLVGKNGSGKSTLVKIINGAEYPSSGEIFLDGKKLSFASPKEAQELGIATVYQELSLVPGLTVAENILMGRFQTKSGFIDWKKTYFYAQQVLDDIGININPAETVENLSMWQCQMVEIAKAMSSNPKVLLLDEPTSSLAQNETEILFSTIRKLKEKDVIIIYISHRLQELWEICDTCTVLRDGRFTGSLNMEETEHGGLLHLMFGDTEVKKKPADLMVSDEVVMKVNCLQSRGKFEDISFELRKGEVLGIAGMLGSGRTELLRAIFGADEFDSGEIEISGVKANKISTQTMKKMGLGLTPEDRKFEGLVQIASIKSNLCNASLDLLCKGIFIDRDKENKFSDRQIESLQIKISDPEQLVSSLSGGNQQKVVVGNWLNTSPKIMLFDEPSRGIDVKAKQQIFDIIWELSRQGVSSIVVSSELEELIEVCQRIIIMQDGRFVQQVDPENLTIDNLYSLCMGGILNEKPV